MSTIINQNVRSIAELEKCKSYSEMSDAEIDSLINYKIEQTKLSIETKARLDEIKKQSDEILELNRRACEQSAQALQYMCEQKIVPTSLEITKLEFHPMEFSHE